METPESVNLVVVQTWPSQWVERKLSGSHQLL